MHHDSKIINSIIKTMVQNGITPASLVGPYEKAVFEATERKSGKLYGPKEICYILKISRSTLFRYVQAGMPYHEKIGKKGRVIGKLYSKPECLSFVKQYKRVVKKEKKAYETNGSL